MRKGQDINFNFVGRASCLLLLLLSFLVASPTGMFAYAEENLEEATNEEGISAQEDAPSTINISFSPATASGALTPITSAGAKARADVAATVTVQNSGGYSVYLGTSKPNLTRTGGVEIIAPISGSVTYDNIARNTWGFAYSTSGAVANDAIYSAVSTVGNGTKLGENTDSSIASDTKTFNLSFAANIGDDKPAGTYSTNVTLSVVSSPVTISTLADLTEMQSMTTKVCEDSAIGDTKQLKDVRDGKYYWVTKLADNKCWMTQNLDLDLSTSKTLTPADSDVLSDWTPGYSTASSATGSTILNSATGQRSWSLGDYRIANPTASSNCGIQKSSAADCAGQFTGYSTPMTETKDANAHYLLGNHYQWNAATAGTGETITGGQATSSICPKGWKLPESNSTTAGSFGGIVNVYSVGNNVSKMVSAPLYFVRGGSVEQQANSLFGYAGTNAAYWSSTPASNSNNAYNLYFAGTNSVVVSASNVRQSGYSIRCIAR